MPKVHLRRMRAARFCAETFPDDQAETDRLRNAIVGNGGQESACGGVEKDEGEGRTFMRRGGSTGICACLARTGGRWAAPSAYLSRKIVSATQPWLLPYIARQSLAKAWSSAGAWPVPSMVLPWPMRT